MLKKGIKRVRGELFGVKANQKSTVRLFDGKNQLTKIFQIWSILRPLYHHKFAHPIINPVYSPKFSLFFPAFQQSHSSKIIFWSPIFMNILMIWA
jgi:hypothetical protein